jgi:hypothetical protein
MELSVNSDLLSYLTNNIGEFLSNPQIFNVSTSIIIVFLVNFYLGGAENKSTLQFILELITYIILGFIIIANLLNYLFGIEIVTKLSDLLTNNPLIEIDINTKDVNKESKPIERKEEVFHVSGNKYTYEDAKPVCKAYGGNLATYDQIERAYNSGAEWCEYGWSEDQLALFPTQKNTWNKLQTGKNKNSCGRPGVNGGYIDNPNIRFGINCYGIKPDITDKEKYLMENSSYYGTPDEKSTGQHTGYWKSQLSSLIVSPFNPSKWNRL